MRWIWIDTFVDFESGKRASAVKNISLAEEYLHDHFPGYPVFPPPLMIEGMAQTAGILAGEARGFAENVILAKIRLAKFEDYARPGDQLRYDAVLDSIDERAAVSSGTVFLNGVQIGRVDLIFSHVRGDNTLGLPDYNFVFTEQFTNLLASFRDQITSGSTTADEG
ncbi:MAG: beta-hydroxyacyl-ACP dehydratase [Phycisphaerales bacterium]|nr:MAG: beta-hydroxyacyl-ACP dehydratase [Phycisphaerales bacterium]